MAVVVGRYRDRLYPPLLAVAQGRVSFFDDLSDLGDKVTPSALIAHQAGGVALLLLATLENEHFSHLSLASFKTVVAARSSLRTL